MNSEHCWFEVSTPYNESACFNKLVNLPYKKILEFINDYQSMIYTENNICSISFQISDVYDNNITLKDIVDTLTSIELKCKLVDDCDDILATLRKAEGVVVKYSITSSIYKVSFDTTLVG